jgi:hypothetical protein
MSGKSPAKRHHRKNRKTRAEKSAAGFLFWNPRIGRRPHIDAATPNAPRPGVASAVVRALSQLAGIRVYFAKRGFENVARIIKR